MAKEVGSKILWESELRSLKEEFEGMDISKCHYLVDLDTAAESPREPRYSSHREEWVTIAYKPFLDASRSSRLLRAFYVPLLSEQHTRYANYSILKARRRQPRRKLGG
ncbi:hypothetical protein EK904_013658 [Melospiza melodia maxima]|nr:hypothetical protein EK904_013658 [Melospiza melodia maxima]